MTLQAVYQQFLASPSSSCLAENASLYYITTTTTVRGSTEIIKHIAALRKYLAKKKEDVLSAVEAKNALVLEIDTTIQFLTGGSVYLPALDDNFLIDRVVHLPIIHIVAFDGAGKIAQIRQSWDQGSLLKQIDVIGRTGRNWPIRDATDQIKMITAAVGVAKENTANDTATDTSSQASLPLRSRGNSATNAMRDPHASLELFAPRDEIENTPVSVVAPYSGVRPRQRDLSEILSEDADDSTPRAVVSPYAGRRPRQRSFTEILGDDDDDDEEVGGDSPTGSSRMRSRSPSKAIAPKAGAAKKFQPVRLFEADVAAAAATIDDDETGKKTKIIYRPNPKKYNHFDFADGTEEGDQPQAGASFDSIPKSKHDSHWSFDDFQLSKKGPGRPAHGQEVRHWGITDEELPQTPPAHRKPAVSRPRPDAETHFEFEDDGMPSDADPHGGRRPRGAGHNKGLGLYENNLYKEDGTAPTPGPDPRALDNITNLKDRSKNFSAHFAMTDSPSGNGTPAKPVYISDDRKKVVKMMESSWARFDDASSPAQKENNIPGTNVLAKGTDSRGIQIAGDGMGNKKGGGLNEAVNRGIQTAGDGMGNKKGGRSWSFGDDDETPELPRAPPKQGAAQKASSFWDF